MEQHHPRQLNSDYNNVPNNQGNEYSEYPKGSYFNQNNNYGNVYHRAQQSLSPFQPQRDYSYQRGSVNNGANIQEYNKNNENVNHNLNHFVREQLQSRGIKTNPKASEIGYNQQVDKDRKRVLLDNIKTQISLTKNTKWQELQRKRDEDDQYLKDMVNSFPFGRGGGGAPVRDKNGMVVTTRRAWISDPKYNWVTINVDDDYNDVWGRDKKYGLVNFKNKTMNMNRGLIPGDNNQNYNQGNQGLPRGNTMPFHQTMPQRNNYSARNLPLNNNMNQPRFDDAQIYNNNSNSNSNDNYQQPPQYFNQNDPNQQYYDNQIQYQLPNQPQFLPQNTRPFSTNPRGTFAQQPQNMNFSPPAEIIEGYNQQGDNYDHPGDQAELNLSYDNYEWDEDKKRQSKEQYKKELLNQMKENENRKWLEKQKKEREDAEEEARWIRENEEIERRLAEERNKSLKFQKETTETNTKVADIPVKQRSNVVNVEKVDSAKVEIVNQQDLENRAAINNELLKLRDQMQNQQNSLLSQINGLKDETNSANNQRFEALKEIDKLKNELDKQRNDEEMRRRYVYDVIRDDNGGTNNIYSQSHLPDATVEKVILPVTNEKNMYYDEHIRHPNRIIPTPKFPELMENQIKTDSRFIIYDKNKVIDGLEWYEPKYKWNELQESKEDEINSNNKGYTVSQDFGVLRSYYQDDDKQRKVSGEHGVAQIGAESRDFNRVSNANGGDTENGQLEVKQIYNRNMERLRWWNDIEGKIKEGHTETKKVMSTIKEEKLNDMDWDKNWYGDKVNYDDFIGKLNNTCKWNY